jgi:hypothetical protein
MNDIDHDGFGPLLYHDGECCWAFVAIVVVVVIVHGQWQW